MNFQERPSEKETHDPLMFYVKHEMVQAIIRDAESCDYAMEMFHKGDYQAAYEIVLNLVRNNSPLIERAKQIAIRVIDELVDEYREEENYERVVQLLNEWLSLDPRAVYPAVAKADVLWLGMGKVEEAKRAYQGIVKQHPHCVEAWIGLTQIALAQGRLKQAMRHLRRGWLSLSQVEWATLPTKEVVVNILESLYALTARLLSLTDDPDEGIKLLEAVLSTWEGSDYLQQELESLRRISDRLPERGE